MKNSIIITYFNGRNVLTECLTSVISSIKYRDDTEIIIVNDNPDDSINAYIRAKFSSFDFIQVYELDVNHGHPYACNYGASKSKGDYLIFMDCDIVVTVNWLNQLESSIIKEEQIGAVSSTILSLSDKKIVIWGVAIHETDPIKPLRGNDLLIKEDTAFNYLTSGCLMVKKSVFYDVQCFDDIMYNSFTDIDLTLKISKLGYLNIMSSSSIVYHKGRIAGVARDLSNADTMAYFYKKWGANLIDDGLDVLEKLYKLQIPLYQIEKEYIIVNLCKTLFLQDYINLLKDCLEIKVIDIINKKTKYDIHGVDLFDILDTTYIRYQIPILFFVPDFNSLAHNYYWARNRVKKDLIIDINGNISTLEAINNNN